jgi:hypothetical protein
VLTDDREQLPGQTVALQQMPESQDRALVRNRVLAELKSRKAAHRLRVVQRFFHAWGRQVEKVLQTVNPQHDLERMRLATLSGLRIVRPDATNQLLPGNDGVHLAQESFSASDLALVRPCRTRKRRLLHRNSLPMWVTLPTAQYRPFRVTSAEFP